MHTESLHASRVFMGDSLGFHIIFVLFGLTLPILVSWFEFMALRRKDPKLMAVAQKWAKVMAVLVIAGVISGTIVALQMSLVWPGILQFGGDVIGLPFMFETYAFLIEAVFLGLYMRTWQSKRVAPWLHWWFGVMIVVGSTLSAFAITAVNAWMNLPAGFKLVHGKFTDVDVWAAMFSRTSLVEFAHSMPAYYLAASLAIASLYGVKLLRTKRAQRGLPAHKLDWFIVNRLVLLAAVMFVALAVTGDITGKYLAKYEPAKLATIEMVDKTTDHAAFVFGGIESKDGSIHGPYFRIPSALSLLAGDSASTRITGLNEIPSKEQPPSYIRALFNIKLTLIMALSIMLAGYVVVRWRWPKLLQRNLLLWTLAVGGWVGIVLVELGWMVTEIGRQPWAVRGYVTTEQALTKTHDVTSFGYIFPLAYVVLGAVTIAAVRRVAVTQSKLGSGHKGVK